MLPLRPKLRIPDLAIDNHPDLVVNESVHLNAARYALREVNAAWAKLRECEAVTTDHKRLAAAATKVVAHADKVTAEALKHLEESRKMLEAKLAAEVTPVRTDQAAAEIRAHFKSQRHPFALLGPLVSQNDRRTLAAILTAPAYLSGLNESQHVTLRDLCRETWYPEETKILKDIDRHGGRVIMLANTVKTTLNPLITEWSGAKEESAFAALTPKQE